MPVLAAVALAVGVTSLVGIGPGILVGGIALLGIGPLLRRVASMEHARALRRDERELAPVASLLAALLASGATVQASLEAVAEHHVGMLQAPLRRVTAAMRLGAEPDQAWAQTSPVLAPIAEALHRSATTGAPAAELLRDVVIDAQRAWSSRAEVAARSAGVRAVLPLVGCFLPAFLLVGVLPVIASVAGSLLS